MEQIKYNLAFDFGASSGRVMLSKFDGKKIEIEEIHRFENEPVWLGKRYYWDFLRLFHELKIGLKKVAVMGIEIGSMGIDTWGVDYGLLDKNDNLLSNPIHYRDSRTENTLKKIEMTINFEEIYKITGIQNISFNTLYQLHSDFEIREDVIKLAKTLLFMPDLFSYYLTGQKYNEYTQASTSQMIDAEKKEWAFELIDKLGIPKSILQNIIYPGNIWGYLTSDVQKEVGLCSIPIVAVGSHDTASAVAGTPLESENSVFLSCGTWSLLGLESKSPIININSIKYNFTNEGGVCNTIRFMKNINGLWLIQELRKNWSEEVESVSFSDIIEAVRKAKNKNYTINPNDEKFMNPMNMIKAIKEYCVKNGQGNPESLGEIASAVYNGLTHEYKNVVDNLAEASGKTIDTINMVGGGIQDEYLCELTAKTTGKKVVAGPIEASVLGNIIVQLMALGEIDSLEKGREIIKNSFVQKVY